MVTRVGLATAFFDLLPVKSWIDFLFSSSSFGRYKKSGLIYFEKFQLQPHQHPPWNSTTINKNGVSVWMMIHTPLLENWLNLVNQPIKHGKKTGLPGSFAAQGVVYAEELSFVTNVPRAIP